MSEPRILQTPAAAHPQVVIGGVDAAQGIVGFRWLDADGNPVDSGGSSARFTPLVGALDPVTHQVTYPEVDDATLIDAIENPLPEAFAFPVEVTRRQLLLALYQEAQVTRAQISAMLSGNEAALIEYEEALTFRRDHPLIGQLGVALGMSENQIDSLFAIAASL